MQADLSTDFRQLMSSRKGQIFKKRSDQRREDLVLYHMLWRRLDLVI